MTCLNKTSISNIFFFKGKTLQMEDEPYENTVASSPQQKKGEKYAGSIQFLF